MSCRRMRSSWLVSLLAATVLSGCYGYEPVQAPTPGMDVRLRLKVEAAVRRSEQVDQPTLYVDGRIVEATPQSVTLDILIARSQTVFQDIVIRDTIAFQRSDLESMLKRKLSVAKTGLFIIGTGAAAALIVTGVAQVVGGNEDIPPDDGTNASVVPSSFGRAFRGFSIPLFRFR